MYRESELDKIKEEIRTELEEEREDEVDERVLTLLAQNKLQNIERSKEEQRYIGWSIFLSKRKVSGAYRTLLIKRLRQRLADWPEFEEKDGRLELEDPFHGFPIRIEFNSYVTPMNSKYHAKISSQLFAYKRYHNEEHRGVMLDLWRKLFKMSGEAYLDFDGFSKMIRRRPSGRLVKMKKFR